MVELMRRAEGASITQLIEAMGWLENSVRGALAGSLKRRGLLITSEKAGNVRVYRVAEPASSSGSAAEAPAPSAQP
jgi:DNA-binding transcriptional regulator PaaX